MKHIFIFFLICARFVGFSQDPYVMHLNKTNGLPSNTVYDVFQDKTGFIWIATAEGVCRYDGFEYKTFVCDFRTSTAGSSIQQDQWGRIWYESFDGFLYYLENDTLRTFNQNHPVGYYPFGIIDDYLFVVQEKGIDIFDLHSLVLQRTVPVNSNILVVTAQGGKSFYVIAGNVYKVNTAGEITSITIGTELASHLPSLIQSDDSSVFLVRSFDSLPVLYHIIGNKMLPYFSINGVKNIQIARFTDSTYWFGTPKGAYAFTKQGKSMNGGKPYFIDKSISSVLHDREGNYWFGTTNDGICFVPDLNARFVETPFRPYKLDRSGNTLWIGTKNDELIKWNLNTGLHNLLFKGASNTEVYQLQTNALSGTVNYTSNKFRIFDSTGRIRFETNAAVKGAQQLDSKFLAYAASGNAGLLSLFGGGASVWDSMFNAHSNIGKGYADGQLITNVRAKTMVYIPEKNTIYYATNIGLYAVDPEHINELKQNGQSLYLNKLVNAGDEVIALDVRGNLLSISSAGMIKPFVPDKALQAENWKEIQKQGSNLFLLSDHALYIYDCNMHSITRIPVQVLYHEINDLCSWNATLILSMNNGLLFYPLQQTEGEQRLPKFVLNAVKVNGVNQIMQNGEVLSLMQNNLELNYSILAFSTLHVRSLYYQINQNEWNEASAQSRTLKLAALAPGKYRINFRFGLQGEPFEALSFQIMKPWWQQGWFQFVWAFIAILLVYIFYRYQMRRIRKRNAMMLETIKLEQSLNQSILSSIKSQMNPHFFYNALNTIQSFIYSNDKANASHYLTRFSKLTRMILEMSEKDKIALQEEIDALNLYLEIERARFDDTFEYSIQVMDSVDMELTKIPSMIVQPYVENAIKHGLLHLKGKKILNLNFDRVDGALQVIIDDNGIGRNRSYELERIKNTNHNSFATKANEKRLEILNRGKQHKSGVTYIDKLDSQGIPAGTRVILTLYDA